MDIKYVLRRLSFAGEIRGVLAKVQFLLEELVSLSTRIRPKGTRSITWMGPHGDLILNYYDSIVCWRAEILDDHLYDIELPETPLILDIGANQGFVTLWFKYNHPNAMIYSYEPVKKSYDILVKNVEDNNLNNCVLINAGVFDENKTHKIYHREGGAGLGDTISSLGTEGCKEEEIQLLNIDPTFNDTDKIDLVKMDIEGSEYNILKNCSFWKKANKIIIEFHDQFKEPFGFKDINFIKLITDSGFILDKKIGNGPIYVCCFSKTQPF